MGTGIIQIGSTFTATPIGAAFEAALAQEGVPQEVRFALYSQMSEFMLQPARFADRATGALLLVRVEDWLRDDLKSATPDAGSEIGARQRLVSRSEDFVNQLSVLTHGFPQVWVLICPSNGWIATRHNLRILCRTYSNVITARIRKLPVTVLNCPPFLLNRECDDHSTDRLGQMPYTQAAFNQLGEFLAAEVQRTLRQSDLAADVKTSDSSEFGNYLASLNLQVELSRPEVADRAHVDRMLRTIASFSLSGERPFLEENEIKQMLSDRICLLVSVSDRLAKYGYTGFVLFRENNQEMVVDEMALSCVVLGKQAEFAVVSALSRYAAARGLLKIVFHYSPTERNQPMLVFLESIATNHPGVGYVVSVSEIERRITESSVKPGAWNISFQPTVDELGGLT
jgi:hypothetical protein